MKAKYNDLYLITLDAEGHAKTCNYWYLIHHGAQSYIAFTHRDSLLKWLAERGLELTSELPEHKTRSSQFIKGQFCEKTHMSYDDFYNLPYFHTSKTMSNGDYTLALFTKDNDGTITVHTLNPNCKHRPIFDYKYTKISHG